MRLSPRTVANNTKNLDTNRLIEAILSMNDVPVTPVYDTRQEVRQKASQWHELSWTRRILIISYILFITFHGVVRLLTFSKDPASARLSFAQRSVESDCHLSIRSLSIRMTIETATVSIVQPMLFSRDYAFWITRTCLRSASEMSLNIPMDFQHCLSFESLLHHVDYTLTIFFSSMSSSHSYLCALYWWQEISSFLHLASEHGRYETDLFINIVNCVPK